ncbi:unnamed protein product [Diamesa hyperborea]
MEENDVATQSEAKNIKPVSKNTIHKICSSQVILNIGVAVKELVENSVDAGAKTIEVKLKNYGSEGFEVSDNGFGIDENNFQGITAKHYTSKLKEFSDLESINTFGFRGEALSSLCCLSNVTITTRHSTAPHGTRLSFDHNGIILQKTICARNIGTTVSLTDFFITLPVRRGEFMKNYKKDFAKMVQLLQEYCLVLTGVKILCTNIPQNGGRQTVISTNGHSVIENIISVFGAKQSKLLTKIKPPTEDGTEEGSYTQQSLADLEEPTSLLDIRNSDLDKLNFGKFRIDGLISNIEHNAGRSSKDRQYFYVNSRPVEPRAIIKLVNEVYRRYNMNQFPFVFLNLKMDQSDVDVNLTPDKRQVLVNNEKILQLAVKRALMNTFEVSKGFNFTEPSLPDFESTRKKIITEHSTIEVQTSLKSRTKKVLSTAAKPDKRKPKKKCVKVVLEMSLEKIRELAFMEEDAMQAEELLNKSKMKLRFKERIDPSKNKNAEAELSTELKKEMFKEMKIIGQFNLGFILVLLNEHLFIVDQHASDEKYNFETLQKSLILQHQPLVIPEKLQLTAINELVLIDNLPIMELNGFKFHIDDNAPPTMKIKLTSKPQSKNIIFGAEDIDELLFMLQEAPNTVCRPSRIRTMLASRACRKSVMIGDPLTKKLMKNLVTHMGEIEHPWNCPHGRPTIRYLANLDLIEK